MFAFSTAREPSASDLYEKAGRRLLEGTTQWDDLFQREFQKSLDRHSLAMERLAAALEASASIKSKATTRESRTEKSATATDCPT